MKQREMSLEEIRSAGLVALRRELGVGGMARFMQLFTSSVHDYTEERHQRLGEPTVDELVNEIERRRAGGAASPNG